MNIFKRLFRVGQSEAHALVDKLEDPIRMTEQGIRDLKKDLRETMRSLAEVKASEIRIRKQAEDQRQQAADFERKAMLLLQRIKDGTLDPEQGEELAREALARQEEAATRSAELFREADNRHQMVIKLESGVNKQKRTIQKYENDLVTLRARARTAGAARKINSQLAGMDSSSTIALLEKMKNKVEEEESLAESYETLAHNTEDLESKIDRALGGDSPGKGAQRLEELKKKMGLLP